MAETALTKTTAPDAWSMTGAALTVTAVDNANGNSFVAASDQLVIVRNPTGGALTFTITSQPIVGGVGTGRTGNATFSIPAGDTRIFRVKKNGWANAAGLVLIPTGLSASLLVGVVDLLP